MWIHYYNIKPKKVGGQKNMNKVFSLNITCKDFDWRNENTYDYL